MLGFILEKLFSANKQKKNQDHNTIKETIKIRKVKAQIALKVSFTIF